MVLVCFIVHLAFTARTISCKRSTEPFSSMALSALLVRASLLNGCLMLSKRCPIEQHPFIYPNTYNIIYNVI